MEGFAMYIKAAWPTWLPLSFKQLPFLYLIKARHGVFFRIAGKNVNALGYKPLCLGSRLLCSFIAETDD